MLARLPEFPKIIQVDSLQVNPATTQIGPNSSPALNIHLHLTGFIFPNDGTATDPLAGATNGAPSPGGAAPEPGVPPAAGAAAAPPPQQRVMMTAPPAHANPRAGVGA
jgi:hypothetical protein